MIENCTALSGGGVYLQDVTRAVFQQTTIQDNRAEAFHWEEEESALSQGGGLSFECESKGDWSIG